MGGKHFKNDAAFIKTAVRDVKRLEKYAGLTKDSRLLDWGCGAGRLAVGVREHFAGGASPTTTASTCSPSSSTGRTRTSPARASGSRAST